MIVKTIRFDDFASYKSAALDLAPGLTLLLGDNGAGKSTVIEAACWALHGETIRGAQPGSDAYAELHFDAGASGSWIASRKKQPGKSPQLALHQKGLVMSGQTATETQRKIDALVGPWVRFAATRIFAREFIAKFGAATDKERKTLLEGLLGLERFDAALIDCREEAAKHSHAKAEAEGRIASLEGQIERLQRSLDEAPAAGRPKAEIEVALATSAAESKRAGDKLRALRALARTAKEAARDARAKAGAVAGQIAALKGQADALATKVARVASLKDCPTCLRPVGEADREAVRLRFAAEAEELSARRAELLALVEAADADLCEVDAEDDALAEQAALLGVEIDAFAARRSNLLRELAVVEAAEGERQRGEKAVEAARTDLEAAGKARQTAEQGRLATEAACEALGLRGARVALLGRALARLEAAANGVLAALGLAIQVAISGTSRQKSGKEVDAISIALEGAGGGDYRAASSGERARVDVALLLALSALAGGTGEGFVAFDEVFDALDQDGQQRVAEYLAGLAETRQVIVVSHHPDLRALFPRGATVLRAVKDAAGVSRLEVT